MTPTTFLTFAMFLMFVPVFVAFVLLSERADDIRLAADMTFASTMVEATRVEVDATADTATVLSNLMAADDTATGSSVPARGKCEYCATAIPAGAWNCDDVRCQMLAGTYVAPTTTPLTDDSVDPATVGRNAYGRIAGPRVIPSSTASTVITGVPVSVNAVNELLADTDDGFCVVVGSVEVDLFDVESIDGHRTYGHDGHFFTGVDAWDGVELCGDDCLSRWAEKNAFPVELSTVVRHNMTVVEVPTFLDPVRLVDAVAFPFIAGDHDPDEHGVSCGVCGRLMVAGSTAAVFIAEAFTSCVDTALWSTVAFLPGDSEEDDPRPLDENYGPEDVDPDTLNTLLADVAGFVAENYGDIRAARLDAGTVGHNFWLNREGHGAGFWDLGLDAIGSRLSDSCRAYGSFDLYVGDDGKVCN
jgi:hypothetical protein